MAYNSFLYMSITMPKLAIKGQVFTRRRNPLKFKQIDNPLQIKKSRCIQDTRWGTSNLL